MKITRRRLLLAAGGLAASGAVYVFGIEPIWLRTVELDIELPGLDPALDGYRIAQLSDFHIGAGVPFDYLQGAVAMANALAPDLIALTGDYLHRGASALAPQVTEILEPLRAPDGVFAVLGNHDGEVYGPKRDSNPRAVARVERALEAAGARVFRNDRVAIRPGLHLAGFGDLWSGLFDPGSVSFDGTTIALSHNPDTAPRLAKAGADLILSGHTHGGQVTLPFLGPPILPVQHREFAAGHVRVGESQLYVNRGIGWLRRVRLFTRPEVTLLRLRPAV